MHKPNKNPGSGIGVRDYLCSNGNAMLFVNGYDDRFNTPVFDLHLIIDLQGYSEEITNAPPK